MALLLARPDGAVNGNNGLALFVLARHLDDGSRNAYRTARLKDRLGTRSMASGEIIFDGAIAHPRREVGPGGNNGLKMMMDQVNMSRLSYGVRAAAKMRRCLNEALVTARSCIAFGEKIIDKPLLCRQLDLVDTGDEQARKLARIPDPVAEVSLLP